MNELVNTHNLVLKKNLKNKTKHIIFMK